MRSCCACAILPGEPVPPAAGCAAGGAVRRQGRRPGGKRPAAQHRQLQCPVRRCHAHGDPVDRVAGRPERREYQRAHQDRPEDDGARQPAEAEGRIPVLRRCRLCGRAPGPARIDADDLHDRPRPAPIQLAAAQRQPEAARRRRREAAAPGGCREGLNGPRGPGPGSARTSPGPAPQSATKKRFSSAPLSAWSR